MSNKKILVFGALLFITGLIFLFTASGENNGGRDQGLSLGQKIIIHKSPTCGCCGAYSSYMKSLDYEVELHDTEDIGAIKSELGVPRSLESCHSAEIAGYTVEGHIPEEVIRKLIDESPSIKGIGLAGMPSGAPGMGGIKMEKFVIYEILAGGKKGEVFSEI